MHLSALLLAHLSTGGDGSDALTLFHLHRYGEVLWVMLVPVMVNIRICTACSLAMRYWIPVIALSCLMTVLANPLGGGWYLFSLLVGPVCWFLFFKEFARRIQLDRQEQLNRKEFPEDTES